jgi:Tfp pilus assembly protein PilF
VTHALELDPKRADALVLRATAWRHLQKLDQAKTDIDKAFALDPDDPDAFLERGIIRQRLGDLAGARMDWEQASTLAPDTSTGDLAQQNLALLAAGPRQ